MGTRWGTLKREQGEAPFLSLLRFDAGASAAPHLHSPGGSAISAPHHGVSNRQIRLFTSL